MVALGMAWSSYAFGGPPDVAHVTRATAIAKVRVSMPKKSGGPYAPGWPLRVAWQYLDPAPGLAAIQLLRDGQVARTICPGTAWGTAGKGYGDWMIPESEYGLHVYRVKVVSTVDANYAGTSAEFVLIPFMKIITPAGAEIVCKTGTSPGITWLHSAGCGETVRIKAVLTSEQRAYDLAAAHPIGPQQSGSYAWTIAPSIPPGQYRLFFTSSNSACSDRTIPIRVIP
jgi:hypothetical protein